MPKDVKIPDVSGMEYEKAAGLLEKEGLQVDSEVLEISDEKIDEGLMVKRILKRIPQSKKEQRSRFIRAPEKQNGDR